jgi:methylated-DNA-protein-cysteine methyltransferase-like protein
MVSTTYEKIYAVVRRVPRGRVVTYGQVAWMAGLRGAARQVGYALHALPEKHNVPWHRVINAHGRVSKRSSSDHDELQRVLLEAEGVSFDERGRVRLDRFGWEPRSKRRGM